MTEALIGGGLLLSAYGQYEQGQRAKLAAELAKTAAYDEAAQYEKQGQEQADYLAYKSFQTIGRETTGTAAGNVDVTQGSPAMAMVEQNSWDMHKLAITLSNSQHKALALRMQGEQGVELGRQRAEAAGIGTVSTLLMGAEKFADMTSRGGGYGSKDSTAADDTSDPNNPFA